ncbi:hypothetical protein T08_1633 [Trichinella sp. T8]|nr:hypothetical protein T08_1633 [Trichinella sp. T8]
MEFCEPKNPITPNQLADDCCDSSAYDNFHFPFHSSSNNRNGNFCCCWFVLSSNYRSTLSTMPAAWCWNRWAVDCRCSTLPCRRRRRRHHQRSSSSLGHACNRVVDRC